MRPLSSRAAFEKDRVAGEILLVDCASGEQETRQILEGAGADLFLPLPENRGYSGGVNAGLARASGAETPALATPTSSSRPAPSAPAPRGHRRRAVGAAAPSGVLGRRRADPTPPGARARLLSESSREKAAGRWPRLDGRRFASFARESVALWERGGSRPPSRRRGAGGPARRVRPRRTVRRALSLRVRGDRVGGPGDRSAGLELRYVPASRVRHLWGVSASRNPGDARPGAEASRSGTDAGDTAGPGRFFLDSGSVGEGRAGVPAGPVRSFVPGSAGSAGSRSRPTHRASRSRARHSIATSASRRPCERAMNARSVELRGLRSASTGGSSRRVSRGGSRERIRDPSRRPRTTRPGIRGLFERVFGRPLSGRAVGLEVRAEPRRGFGIVATRDGVIGGQLRGMGSRGSCSTGEQALLYSVGDVATDPAVRSLGGRRGVYRAMAERFYESIAGRRPLLLRIPESARPRGQPPAHRLADALPDPTGARRLCEAFRLAPRAGTGDSVDASFDPLWSSAARFLTHAPVRDRARVNWRFHARPDRYYRMVWLEEGRGASAWGVLSVEGENALLADFLACEPRKGGSRSAAGGAAPRRRPGWEPGGWSLWEPPGGPWRGALSTRSRESGRTPGFPMIVRVDQEEPLSRFASGLHLVPSLYDLV